ncbi:hypothetical protein D3C73_1291100 [compost metagenome]
MAETVDDVTGFVQVLSAQAFALLKRVGVLDRSDDEVGDLRRCIRRDGADGWSQFLVLQCIEDGKGDLAFAQIAAGGLPEFLRGLREVQDVVADLEGHAELFTKAVEQVGRFLISSGGLGTDPQASSHELGGFISRLLQIFFNGYVVIV